LSSYSQQVGRQLLLSEKNIAGACTNENTLVTALGEISLNVIQPTPGQNVSHSFSVRHQTKSPFPVTSVKFYLNNIELKSSVYTTPTVIDISTISIPESMTAGTYTLKVIATDEK
jgi:phosphoribosylcarboxyaminoimidazole (NCAIR) mutase